MSFLAMHLFVSGCNDEEEAEEGSEAEITLGDEQEAVGLVLALSCPGFC